MTDPRIALLVVTGSLLLAVLLFWPGRGLAWQSLHGLRVNERVLIEDALKHLWDCEYRGTPATLQSVSGFRPNHFPILDISGVFSTTRSCFCSVFDFLRAATGTTDLPLGALGVPFIGRELSFSISIFSLGLFPRAHMSTLK